MMRWAAAARYLPRRKAEPPGVVLDDFGGAVAAPRISPGSTRPRLSPWGRRARQAFRASATAGHFHRIQWRFASAVARNGVKQTSSNPVDGDYTHRYRLLDRVDQRTGERACRRDRVRAASQGQPDRQSYSARLQGSR
jgi:hypothetical protein